MVEPHERAVRPYIIFFIYIYATYNTLQYFVANCRYFCNKSLYKQF